MAREKHEDPPAGAPAWMATFSDLMNLLLCFFVLLFSMSTTEVDKFEMVITSLQSAFSVLESGGSTVNDGMLVGGGISQMPDFADVFGTSMTSGDDVHGNEHSGDSKQEGGGRPGQDSGSDEGSGGKPGVTEGDSEKGGQDTAGEEKNQAVSEEEAEELLNKKSLAESERMAEKLQQQLTKYGVQNQVSLDFNGQYVRFTLNGALLFDSGSADVKPEAMPLMKKLAKILNTYDSNLIEIEGHTDNVPISSGRFESNMVLSMYRALHVSQAIGKYSKVDASHIYPSGRGEFNPIADNTTSEGRARNRRVEIKIYNSYNSEEVGS